VIGLFTVFAAFIRIDKPDRKISPAELTKYLDGNEEEALR